MYACLQFYLFVEQNQTRPDQARQDEAKQQQPLPQKK